MLNVQKANAKENIANLLEIASRSCLSKQPKKNEESKSKNDNKNEDNNAKKGDAADEKKKRVRKNLAKMKTASNVVVKAKKNKGCVIS